MRKKVEKRPLLGSLAVVFSKKKTRLAPQKRQPEEYFKQLWLPRKLYNGLVLVAEMENTSVRKAAINLLTEGFSKYMGNKIAEHMQNRQATLEGKVPYHLPDRQIKILRQYIKSHGVENPRIDNGYKIV